MIKKLLLFICILMNLACMMLAALLFALRSQGRAVLFLGETINPTTAIIVLMVLAMVFMVLATQVVTRMWKQ